MITESSEDKLSEDYFMSISWKYWKLLAASCPEEFELLLTTSVSREDSKTDILSSICYSEFLGSTFRECRNENLACIIIPSGFLWYSLVSGQRIPAPATFKEKLIPFCRVNSILTELGDLPKTVKTLDLSACEKLTSLKGCPTTIQNNFYLVECPKLNSLEYFPDVIGGNLDIRFSSLELLVSDREIRARTYIGENIVRCYEPR